VNKTKLNYQKEFATANPLQAGKRKMNKWPQISVDETTDVEQIVPFIKKLL